MQYYIFKFADTKEGKQFRHEFAGIPNGYPFQKSPIHVNSNGKVWVSYPSSKNVNYIKDTIDLLNQKDYVEVIPTGITEEIVIPSNVTSRDDKKFNLKMVNTFSQFAPHIDLS